MKKKNGLQYIINDQGQLICSPINRSLLIPLGLIFLLASITILAFDWWLYFSDEKLWEAYQKNNWYELALNLLLPIFVVGLLIVGLHKKIVIDTQQKITSIESGWFKFNISRLETSRLPLTIFDRIVILPTNWIGLDIEIQNRNLHFTRPGTRYSVRLMGHTELILNRFKNIESARQFARDIKSVSKYPVKELL